MRKCLNSILHLIHSSQCYGSCARSVVIEASLSLFHSGNIFLCAMLSMERRLHIKTIICGWLQAQAVCRGHWLHKYTTLFVWQ